MSKARCFNCKVGLPVCGKSLEELIEIKLPIFCSTECSLNFPDNGTKEFNDKIKELGKYSDKQ